MHSSSRRAFLRGRRIAQSPWEQFCQRLRRTVAGEFIEFPDDGTVRMGRLTVEQPTDIHHVRALCREYDVVLHLDGLSMPARQSERPMVWVRPGKGLSRFGRIEEDGKRWFVQPGCTLGQLVDAGLEQLAHLPRSATIAAWLADRTLSDYAIGSTWRSGVEHLSLLLGDGQSVHLGPFSVENTKPLDGLRLQQLVPALFRLTGSADARQCSDAAFWSGRYRLDALMPVSGEHRNLAHLCLGHGGDLGWIEWVVLNTEFLDPKTSHPGVFSTETVRQSGLEQAAAGLDREMKSLFDPDGVFPRSGQRL